MEDYEEQEYEFWRKLEEEGIEPLADAASAASRRPPA